VLQQAVKHSGNSFVCILTAYPQSFFVVSSTPSIVEQDHFQIRPLSDNFYYFV